MGKALSVFVRQAQRFNVENRAQKVIAQPKPTVAPKFESNQKDLDRILREHPEIVEEHSRKHAALDDNLKRVFVTSQDIPLEPSQSPVNPEKPLPINRSTVEEYEFGHLEPKTVSRGRCTLRQAVQFISHHQTDPATWTVEKIAADYRMKEPLVSSILQHFKTFEVHLPDKNLQKRKLLTSPQQQQHQQQQQLE